MLGTLGAPASHFTLQDPGLSPLQLETDRAMGFPPPPGPAPLPPSQLSRLRGFCFPLV